MTKENSKNIIFESFFLFMTLGGWAFEKGKRGPNESKVIFLLIKTYFLEYLRSERSLAARRCACFVFLLFSAPSTVSDGRCREKTEEKNISPLQQHGLQAQLCDNVGAKPMDEEPQIL